MTCLIATPEFICADRRVTSDGGEKCPNLVKVYANVGLVIASAGNAARTFDIAKLCREGKTDPKDYIDCMGDDSTALCLTEGGQLWYVSEGAVWPVRRKLAGCGSGADLAIGFLHGKGKSDKAAVKQAQQFVASRRTDCGGGCDFRTFKKK